jgi:protein-disulfide isomerase
MSRGYQARRRERRRLQSKRAEQAANGKSRLWSRRTATPAIACAVVIAGILIATVRSSGRQPIRHLSSTEIQTVKEVSALLNGIPQHGNTLGQPTAPVTVQVFGDLECATVRIFVLLLLPSIIRDWVRENIVKIQYRSLETDTYNPRVFLVQQAAALAAGEQGKMWNFVETFYHEQGPEYTGYVTEDYLNGIANQVPGLNIELWDNDRHNIQLAKQVITDDRTARRVGFHDTPSFLIGRTGEKMTKLLGDQIYELTDNRGEKKRLLYPVSLISSQILKEAIERLP